MQGRTSPFSEAKLPDWFVDLQICRKMGWTPTELSAQPAVVIEQVLELLAIENEVEAMASLSLPGHWNN